MLFPRDDYVYTRATFSCSWRAEYESRFLRLRLRLFQLKMDSGKQFTPYRVFG